MESKKVETENTDLSFKRVSCEGKKKVIYYGGIKNDLRLREGFVLPF